MTARYAATLAATAEAAFLKHKKIGAHGADIDLTPSDIYEMTQLVQRTDRVLPNGVCLLPPLKSCDKGNACLSCGQFATDATHLAVLRHQLAATETLITQRRDQYRQRSGRELGEDNIWIIERRREIASLHAINASKPPHPQTIPSPAPAPPSVSRCCRSKPAGLTNLPSTKPVNPPRPSSDDTALRRRARRPRPSTRRHHPTQNQ